MVKYRPVFKMLQEQHASSDAGESIPDWLNTLCNSPSRFENIPLSTSSTSSPPTTPPATPPQLRMRKRPPPRKPLQPSQGNQGPPARSSLKRKINNRDGDAEERLSWELRSKAKLKKSAKYHEEKEQVLHSQHGLGGGLGSPQKQQARGRGRGTASSQVRAIDGGQLLAGPGFVPHGIGAAKPTTPLKGQGRGSGSPDRRPQSPSKSSHASDRTGWMARLNPGVRFLSPSECLKDREVTPSARNFWLNYIRSDDNECFIPSYFQVSDVLSMPCFLRCAC